MIVGFTGTQRGMTLEQRITLRKILSKIFYTNTGFGLPQFRHGDCIGADSEAHDIARDLGYWIAVHPPTKSNKRAHKKGNLICATKDYLDRNKDIVSVSNVLIAIPGEVQEMIRSGTWSTIRYAKKNLKPVVIIWPDGSYDWGTFNEELKP
jgi:hypothetical protein